MCKNKSLLISILIGGFLTSLISCGGNPTPDPDPDPPVPPTPVVDDKITLTSPQDGSTHEVLDSSYKVYLNASTESEQIAALEQYEKSNPSFKSVKLTWNSNGSAFYNLTLSNSADFVNPSTYRISGLTPYLDLDNLIPGEVYYWKVSGNKNNDTSEVRSFMTDDSSSLRVINASGGANIRDLGGWKINDTQQVRYGLLYRGNCLNGFQNAGLLTEEGKDTFNNQLGIKTELDFRKVDGDDGSQKVNYFDENKPYVKATLDQYTSIVDPVTWAAVKTSEKSIQVTSDRPSGGSRGSLVKIFDLLSNVDNYPIYAHCNVGADRTGTFAYLVNGLLGVSYEDLVKDFELTSFSSRSGVRYRSKLNEDKTAFDPSGVYMTSNQGNFVAFGALNDVITTYYPAENLSKSIERYLTEYVGISSDTIEKVKTILIEGYEPKNVDVTISERQTVVVKDDSQHSITIDEGTIDENSVTSVLLGNKELGTDLSKLELGDLPETIYGNHSLLISAKKNGNPILVAAPIKIITQEIKSLNELTALVNYKANNKPVVYGYYSLVNDIGSLNDSFTNGGFPAAPEGIAYWSYQDCYGFQGTLDGNGHTITGKVGGNGLFYDFSGSAVVKDVTFNVYGFTNSYNTAHYSVMGVTMDGATFNNVTYNIKEGPTDTGILAKDWCGLISSGYVKNNVFNNLTINAEGIAIPSIFGGTANGFVNNNKFNGLAVKAKIVKELGHDTNAMTVAYLRDVENYSGRCGEVCQEYNEYNMKNSSVNLYLGEHYENYSISNVSFKGVKVNNFTVTDGEIKFKNENIIKDEDQGDKIVNVVAVSPDKKLTYDLEVPLKILSSYEKKYLSNTPLIDLSDSTSLNINLEDYASKKQYIERIMYKNQYKLGSNPDSLDVSMLTNYKELGPGSISIFINDNGEKIELVAEAVVATRIIDTFEEFNKGVLTYNKDISQSAVNAKIDGYYYLKNDIGSSDISYSCFLYDYWDSSIDSCGFYGIFDGGGHTIKGCSSKVVSGQRGIGGFFGLIGPGAVIKNATFEDYQYHSEKTHLWDDDALTFKHQAVLAGSIKGATLENLTFKLINGPTTNVFGTYSEDGYMNQTGWISSYAASNSNFNNVNIEASGKYIGSVFGGNCNPSSNKFSSCVFTSAGIKWLAHSGETYTWHDMAGITYITK